MDKRWMNLSRTDPKFLEDLEGFLKFATSNAAIDEQIWCPCQKCYNRFREHVNVVASHVMKYGFLKNYSNWVLHGERIGVTSNDVFTTQTRIDETEMSFGDSAQISGLVRDAFGMLVPPSIENNTIESPRAIEIELNEATNGNDTLPESEPNSHPTSEEVHYQNLIEQCEEELYPGCKTYSKLSFILHLCHLKCMNGWSSKSFTMLLEMLSNAFPMLSSFPLSWYEAKKLINKLGLGYEKIDACPNDCMLFWNDGRIDNTRLDNCLVCTTSRWENPTEVGCSNEGEQEVNSRKKAKKVLRYFPLIPRLKRIYMSSKTAEDMRWHENGRVKDGKLRHPADGLAWKEFDSHYPDFALDPRNVRLGLASDGFNPFRTLSTSHSTWPVVLVPYNLPPWTCMKKSSFILSMIIPGEKGPGNDIDVYLQPLIYELRKLWEGVDAFNSFAKQNFHLRAALMWTINDFPAYANLSGWSTKGALACPCCAGGTSSRWLKHGKKFCYMRHRRWLPDDHIYRFQPTLFDGTIERDGAPTTPSGIIVRRQMDCINHAYGKSAYRPTRFDVSIERPVSMFEDETNDQNDDEEEEQLLYGYHEQHNWKKRSIFFDLPYWQHHRIRHNLDVMHIEKNICDNLLGTLLGVDRKSKDNYQARMDLKDMGIRQHLHPIDLPNDKYILPNACYTMNLDDKVRFLSVLQKIKVPDGYASNISRCVSLKDKRLFNLKSHDGHILMQDLLPIALRSSMSSEVIQIVVELSLFFKSICSKELDLQELDNLHQHVVITLCHMEKIFPPSFFTSMVHLIVHLPEQAKFSGPISYSWMYLMERFLVTLKSYVRNRAHPEGSIAEGYNIHEYLTFCSRYFGDVETVFNRMPRNDDFVEDFDMYLFNTGGRSGGKIYYPYLDDLSLKQAHRYVLIQHDQFDAYRRQFIREKRRANRHIRPDENMERKWLVEEFPPWFQLKVQNFDVSTQDGKILKALARGPNNLVRRMNSFITRGYRFHTTKRDERRKTQNSGVVVVAEGRKYYGKIRGIYELNYYGTCKVVLFRCDWVNVNSSRGLKHDDNGFTLVNFNHLIHTGSALKDDPFVLSSQATQVFYVKDGRHEDWVHIVETKPRDNYQLGASTQQVDDDDVHLYPEFVPSATSFNTF